MILVTLVLLMFLNNVRTALIVAINIPLALFIAFAVLVPAGQIGEFALHRRRRFRHHRRFGGHHGGKHLSPSRCRRTSGVAPQAAHLAGHARNRQGVVFFDRHHGLCFHSTLHDERRRRAVVRPNGAYLCLRAGRGLAAVPDAGSGIVLFVPGKNQAGAGQFRRALHQGPLSHSAAPVPALPLCHGRLHGRLVAADRALAAAKLGARIHAGIGGGQLVDPRNFPGSCIARRGFGSRPQGPRSR